MNGVHCQLLFGKKQPHSIKMIDTIWIAFDDSCMDIT